MSLIYYFTSHDQKLSKLFSIIERKKLNMEQILMHQFLEISIG